MRIVKSIAAMQRLARQWRKDGVRIGLVPTMGFLHAGHASLMRQARAAVGAKGKIVVSIYVNPTQFSQSEDLSKYPRDLTRDRNICLAAGVDAVFLPNDASMYPAGFSTWVTEEKLGREMEGKSRPAHFRGVTTIVTKLFNIVLPDVAIFGAKDFQQGAIVRRMVKDLNIPVKILVSPTVRERDGLAMSSRNKYLSSAQRVAARVLFSAIQTAKLRVKRGKVAAAMLARELRRLIEKEPEAKVDYIHFFDPITLQSVSTARRGTQIALAVFIGKTRLIDNGRL